MPKSRNRGYELVQPLAVDADRACVAEALVHLTVQADGGSSIRCARR